MSLIKQLAGETAIYGVSTILPRILHYAVFTIYLTKRVFANEQGQYGIYADLYAYAALLLILFTYRLDTAYFRFGHSGAEEKIVFSTGVLTLLSTSFVFVLFLIFTQNSIANVLRYPGEGHYVVYFALIIGLDALSALPFARLRLTNQARKFAIIRILSVIINLALVFFFLELCPRLLDAGYTQISNIYDPTRKLDLLFVSNLVASLVVFLLLSPQLRFVKIKRFSRKVLVRMLHYLLPLIVVGLAGVFNQSFAVPLIKYLLPVGDVSAEMGIYAAAAKLAILMNLFTVAFNYAAEPFFFKQSVKDTARDTYAQVGKAFAMVASTVLLAILLYLDLIQYMIGANYRSGLSIVPILLVAYWFLGMYYNLSVWYKITDKTKYGAAFSLVGVALTLLVTIVLIRDHGKEALAWAALACYVSMTLLAYIYGRKHYPVPYPLKRIFFYLFLALGIYFLHTSITSEIVSMPIRLTWSTVLLLVYLGAIYLLEKKQLKEWIQS